MQEFRHLEASTLHYDVGLCIGCGNCLAVCPHHVFELGNGKASCRDKGVCMECGACALNCPVGALQVRSGVGCAQAILYGWLSKIPVLRRIVTPDACCS